MQFSNHPCPFSRSLQAGCQIFQGAGTRRWIECAISDGHEYRGSRRRHVLSSSVDRRGGTAGRCFSLGSGSEGTCANARMREYEVVTIRPGRRKGSGLLPVELQQAKTTELRVPLASQSQRPNTPAVHVNTLARWPWRQRELFERRSFSHRTVTISFVPFEVDLDL